MNEGCDNGGNYTSQVPHGWRAALVNDPVTFLLLDDQERVEVRWLAAAVMDDK